MGGPTVPGYARPTFCKAHMCPSFGPAAHPLVVMSLYCLWLSDI